MLHAHCECPTSPIRMAKDFVGDKQARFPVCGILEERVTFIIVNGIKRLTYCVNDNRYNSFFPQKRKKKKKQTLIAMQDFPDCYTRPKNEVLTVLLS